MAGKNSKQKKSVIGKFPLGGPIGGLSPELLALLQKYASEQQSGVSALNTGSEPSPLPTDNSQLGLGPNINLGTPLTPDLGADIGSNNPMNTSVPSSPNFGDLLGSELTKNASNFSALGTAQTMLANKAGFAPDVNQGISGGALSGLGTGLSMGGPLGGLLGLVGGGALGFMDSAQKREGYETALERAKKQRVKDRTVDPFMGVLYAEEGGTTPGEVTAEELSPVQTELKEMALLPSGILTQTKAKEKHDDMDEDDVTDILPAGSVIFSNSLDNMLNITNDIREDLLGFGTAFYSEEGEESEVEHVEFGDILDKKKKKATFAEVADNIKTKFSTVNNKKDIFANITNTENMQARMPFLSKLIQLQDVNTGNGAIPTTAQAFKYGGVVKKYVDGGLIDIIKNALKGVTIPPGGGADPIDPNQPKPVVTIEDLLQQHKDFLANTKSNLEKENTDITTSDSELEKQLRQNNALANGILGPMGYLMQNPEVKPAYKDTNLSGAMFKPGSNQATQGIANTGLAQANSLAQELMRQGVNPVDAISMTAGARKDATNSANEINWKQLQKQEDLDRAKYTFLSEARTANDAADVKAYNDTTDNQNKIVAGLAGEGKTLLKDKSSIDVASNQWRTQRAKDYYESITNLGKSDVDLSTKMYEMDKLKKEADDRDKAMKSFLDSLKGNTSANNNGTPPTPPTPPTDNLNIGNRNGSGELILAPVLSDTPTQYTPVAPSNILDSSIPSPEDAKGMNPAQIGSLQRILNEDRRARNLPTIAEDSVFGPDTKQAIIDAQTAQTVDSHAQDKQNVVNPLPNNIPPVVSQVLPSNKLDRSSNVQDTPGGGKLHEYNTVLDSNGTTLNEKVEYDKNGKKVSSVKQTSLGGTPNGVVTTENYDTNGRVSEFIMKGKDSTVTTKNVYSDSKSDKTPNQPIAEIQDEESIGPDGKPIITHTVINYDIDKQFKDKKVTLKDGNKDVLVYEGFWISPDLEVTINMDPINHKKATVVVTEDSEKLVNKEFDSYESASDFIKENKSKIINKTLK